MYKELVISIIIVIVVISLDCITQKYTENSINKITQNLSQLKEEIDKPDVNKENAVKKANDIYGEWLNYHDKLVYYIEHDELEKVETDFVTCKSFVESEKYDLALSELEKTTFVLQHISDKYAFKFENIF